MKKSLCLLFIIVAIACATKTNTTDVITDRVSANKHTVKNDTVRIANDSLEYEITIIEPGFNTWLASVAKPRNYYGLTYLETRNKLYVMEWNRRVLEPQRYNSNLYELRIDYDPRISYGYEVNFLLYNYFLYFQQQYKQKL